MPHAIQILLCTDDSEHRRQWSQALADAPCQLVSGLDGEVTNGIDVVVTDRPLNTAEDERAVRAAHLEEVGIIAVGTSTPADVSLSATATARELALACLLLGQIVQLRRDRHENLRSREVLSQQALSDPLTGLPNRRAYDQELARRMRGLANENSNLCLILIDLDHFKEVNDRLGHAEGDRVLKAASGALTDTVRSHDFVARLGGDEFAILISNLAAASASTVVERIRCSVSGSMDAQLTASVGFAILVQPASAAELFDAADKALFQAKEAGRNRANRAEIAV